MDAKRTQLQEDALACARAADILHRTGYSDLANSIIEAMYDLLSAQDDTVTAANTVTRAARKIRRHDLPVVENAEIRHSNGGASAILP